VTEFCAGGELWELCKFVGEPEYRAKVWFKQLIEAVSYMHRMGIVHRDLKAENVLLSAGLCTVKICDFGSARDVFNPHIRGASTVSNRKSFQHYVGTSNFLSPEAITNTENDFVSDIWSLGCLFYQVLCGIPPFVAGSEYLVYIRIRAADLQIPPRGLSQEAQSLIRSMVQNDRNLRPSLYEISSHEFFLNTPGDQLPDYNSDDNRVRKIIRAQSDDRIPEQLLGQSTYFEDRLDLAHTVKRWRDSSAPGTGLGTVEHLMDRVPELAGLKNFTQSTDTLDSIQTIS
jgi:serine/threonine protein kinase